MDVNEMMENLAYRLMTLKGRLCCSVLELLPFKCDFSVLKWSEKMVRGGLSDA